MIVREHPRRGEIVCARIPHEAPARKRLAGRRTDTTDDKGRETMPFDLLADEPCDWVAAMADAFGSSDLR